MANKQVDYRKLFAIQKKLETILKKACPNISHKSGIYFYIREDEKGKSIYLGKAQDLIQRNTSHLQGYQQHIDISIKKRGFYSEENFGGWKLNVLEFPESELNEKERYYIDLYRKAGYRMYNVESGGSEGKTDINERKLGKGYYDGVKQGYLNGKRLIAHLFDKHLDCVYKGSKEPTKNQQKAMAKFQEFIMIESAESRDNKNEKENENADN